MSPRQIARLRGIFTDLAEAWGHIRKPKHIDEIFRAYWSAQINNRLDKASEIQMLVENDSSNERVVQKALVPALQVIEQGFGALRSSGARDGFALNVLSGEKYGIPSDELTLTLIGEAETMLAHVQQYALISAKKAIDGGSKQTRKSTQDINEWLEKKWDPKKTNACHAKRIAMYVDPKNTDGSSLSEETIRKKVAVFRESRS